MTWWGGMAFGMTWWGGMALGMTWRGGVAFGMIWVGDGVKPTTALRARRRPFDSAQGRQFEAEGGRTKIGKR
jgi:hypothetical protein